MTNFYTDIFATKGIEYILIIGFFLIIVPFYYYLREVEGPLFSLSNVRLPKGVFFDKTHTWAYLKSAGQVQVGIDDFLAALTGPVSLELHKVSGDVIERGDHLATLLSKGKSLKVYAPVSGTIQSINKKAINRFSKRTDNEFTKNWLLDMSPKRWDVEKAMLIIGDKAQSWIQRERSRLRDILAFAERKYDLSVQPILLQEGGEIEDKVLESLSPEIWEEFQSEFIDAQK